MAATANLWRALGKGTRKFSETQGSVTGTGGIATGLGTIDTGGAVAQGINSATTIPTNVVSGTSVSGGTVNVVVVALAAAANSISAVAELVNVIAAGF